MVTCVLDLASQKKHGSKTDLLIEKKPSDFGRIISLPNAENPVKICRDHLVRI